MKDMLIRWRIDTDDRIGMVRDILAKIANHAGNIEALEVVAGVLYVRFRVHNRRLDMLQCDVLNIEGVHTMHPVDKLPFEAEEERLIRRVMNQEDEDSALSFSALLFQSDVMKQAVQMAKAAARGQMPVLIEGESGTGKELLARAIHNASARREARFLPINCAAIPDALLESELFGYAEGSFTGAVKGGRQGMFEVADQGTLFLDEIGEMNPSVQVKLLRALAEGEIRRVGATETTKVNVRIIAATNQNLRERIREGMFREDLYYRLNVIPVHLPPLRQRQEDILLLAEQFLQRMAHKLDRAFKLSSSARDALSRYGYPGNVRELQNILERACYLSDGETIHDAHLLLPTEQTKTVLQTSSEHINLRQAVHSFELQMIRQAIADTGSLRKAAQRLGVSHTTLSNKLRAPS